MSLSLAPRWKDQPATVRAAFTLRARDAGVGDAPDSVAANRRVLRDALRLPSEPTWLSQVHGISVLDLEAPDAPRGAAEAAPQADAAVTRAPGRVLAIQVADCLPVLFASRSGMRVGAAHAGWRGLAAGVLEATLAALATPAAEVSAWIGPGICRDHFEVGDEVREAFVRHSASAANAFTRNPRGRWQCDLTRLATERLRAAGVSSVSLEGGCTYAQADRFYSYRRDGQCGRMAALIWLAPGAGSA